MKQYLKDSATWPSMIKEMEIRLQDKDTELTDLSNDNKGLQDLIMDRNTEIKTLERQLILFNEHRANNSRGENPGSEISVSHHRPRVQLMKDPVEYSDEKGEIIYEDWKIEMKNKMSVDEASMPTVQRQIAYIFERTKAGSEAKEVLRPGYNDGEFDTVEQVWKLLDETFENPNKMEDAEKEMKKLHQRGNAFHVFVAKYKRLCKTLEYSKDKKKDEFVKRLTSGFRLAVGIHIYTMEFDDIVSALTKYSKTEEASKSMNETLASTDSKNAKKTSTSTTTTTTQNTTTGSIRTPFDPNATRASAYERLVKKQNDGTFKGIFRTESEKSALREAGLCFKCIKPNHGRDTNGGFIECPEKEWLPMPTKLIVAKNA